MPAVKLWTGTRWAYTVPTSNVHMINLAADGTDQTAVLQAALNAVPDGVNAEDVQIALLPSNPAGYRIDGKITISNRQHLIVEGSASSKFYMYSDFDGIELGMIDGNGSSTRQHWLISGCNDVALRNIKVRGPNQERDANDNRWALYTEARAFEHGFAIQGASNDILLENLEVYEVCGDGLYIGGTGSQNTDVKIRNVIGTHSGRQQMGIVNVDGCLIEDVDIRWGGRSGMDIEPNHDTHFVRNITLRRVTMGSKFYPFVIGGSSGDSLIHNENIVLEDCVGLNAASSHTAILASRTGTNVTVRRHRDVRQRSTQGMTFGGWTGTLLIEDCEVSSGPSTPTSYGVVLNNVSAAVTIRNSSFNGPSSQTVGSGGADELYIANGTTQPASVTHCGNVWNMSGSNDGVCV